MVGQISGVRKTFWNSLMEETPNGGSVIRLYRRFSEPTESALRYMVIINLNIFSNKTYEKIC
jgi:hypothetical protein